MQNSSGAREELIKEVQSLRSRVAELERVDTRSKEIEKALQNGLAQLFAIFKNAPILMLLVDSQMRVQKANNTTLQFADRRNPEIVGFKAGEALQCRHCLDDPKGCGFGSFCGNCILRRVVMRTFEASRGYCRIETQMPFVRQEQREQLDLLISTVPVRISGEDMVVLCLEDVTEQKKARAQISDWVGQTEILNSIVITLSESLELKQVLDTALERTQALLKADGGVIYLFDETSQTFRSSVHRGISQEVLKEATGFKIGEGLSGRVAQSGRVLVLPDLGADPRNISPASAKGGWHSYSGVPVKSKGRVLAVLVLVSRKKDYFKVKQIEMLQDIGSHIGIAIEHAKLYEGLQQELTQREKAEEELVERERRFSDIADNALEWIWEVDINGKYIYSSPVVEKILGYKPEELLKKHFYDFFPPEDREELKKTALEVFAQKQPFNEFINQNVHKNGKIVWLSTSGVPIIDEKGNLVGYRGADTDITERKRAEQEIESMAKFLSENPYPILRIAKDGIVLYANQPGVSILEGKNSGIGQSAPREWQKLVSEVLKTGSMQWLDVEHLDMLFAFQVVPVVDANYVNFYGADITERKNAEMERELMIRLLSLINSPNQMHELMKIVSTFLKDWTGCDAIGIRLRDGDDYPYYVTEGFSKEFVLTESKLCSVNELGELVRDSQGRVFLECMCGNIISGRFDPSKPYFTEHGSFWTNSTTDLLATTTMQDRLAKTRNLCNTAGYESVALIPLRIGKETFGLLQFNSKDEDHFTPEKISLFEKLADNLAIGLAQRRAELALRESEERYRAIFEQAADSILLIDVKEGRFVVFNDKACESLGYTREEFGKLKISDIEVIKSAKEIIREGASAFETKHRRKDGQIRDVVVSSRAISIGGKDFMQSIWRDITEHKEMEQMLRNEKEWSDTIVKSAPNIVVGLGEKSKILLFNEFAEKLTGYKAEDILGKRWIELFIPVKIRKQMYNVWKEIVSTKAVQHCYENPIVTKKGQERIISWSNTVLLEDGKFRMVLSIGEDITERKKAERRLLEDRAKLKSLASQLTLAEERGRHRIAEELHDQVSQSLAISKIKLDSLHASASSVEDVKILDEVRKSLEQTIDHTRSLTFDLSFPVLYESGLEAAVSEWLVDYIQKKHGIVTELEDDDQPKPLDDDVRVFLFRNIRELLINVVKHAHANKVKVSLRKASSQIYISIEDNGIGLDSAKIAAMAAKKAGFGLFSIRERLEELGGRLEIKSSPKQGCNVIMTAPLKRNKNAKEGKK